MTQAERATKAGQTYYVYLLVETETNAVIYVGQTRYLGRRINEHISSTLDSKNHAPLYIYLRGRRLALFEGVDVKVIARVFSRQESEIKESELIEKYKDTCLNKVKLDTRRYNTDPRHKKVKCVTDGREWWAVAPAEQDTGISRYKIEKSIKTKTPVNGLQFEWVR